MITLQRITLIIGFVLIYAISFAQIAVNTDGSEPNENAILDVKSSTMGLLIPRLTTVQRNAFESVLDGDERGMLVFDTDTGGFYFFNGTIFEKLASGVISGISDTDNDTYVETELTPDADHVSFVMDGTVYYTMMQGRIETYNNGKSVFIGDNAGAAQDNSLDLRNIGIGNEALQANEGGANNVAIGDGVLKSYSGSYGNIGIGVGTLGNNTYQSGLVAIGDSALFNNGDTGWDPGGYYNTAVGYRSLYTNLDGDYNTALGYRTLTLKDYGDANTAVGSFAMDECTQGGSNTAIGYKTLSKCTSFSNTALGALSLRNSTTGKYNVSIGYSNLYDNISGSYNVSMGSWALYNNETGKSNIAIGYKAAYKSEDISNVIAIGDSALFMNGSGTLSGDDAEWNIAIGKNALKENTSGRFNTSFGNYALLNNINGDANIAFGFNALYNSISGSSNLAIGNYALYFNTEGENNISIGNNSLIDNTEGAENVGIGVYALNDNTTGSFNTALGNAAIGLNISGGYNTAVGFASLYNNKTGFLNTCVGYQAGMGIETGSNNIFIGNDIYATSLSQSNTLNIGNLLFGNGVDGTGTTISSGNIGIGNNDPNFKLDIRGEDMQIKSTTGKITFFIDPPMSSGNSEIQFQEGNNYRAAVGYNTDLNYMYFYEGGNMTYDQGNLGIGTVSSPYRLQVGNSGDGTSARANAWNTFSDRILKKDLSIIDQPLDKINQISGYYYYWKEGEDKNRQVGIVAQEVEEILPEIVSTDPEGIKSVDYAKLTPLLIEALKAQQNEIDELRQMINDLK